MRPAASRCPPIHGAHNSTPRDALLVLGYPPGCVKVPPSRAPHILVPCRCPTARLAVSEVRSHLGYAHAEHLWHCPQCESCPCHLTCGCTAEPCGLVSLAGI